MKDFVKWLGVNEKIAKVVVWLLIIMISLIVFNTGLESIGFPYYKITYQNLQKINITKFLDIAVLYIVSFLSFYSMVLLVFRIRESKKILKYAILYIVINAILSQLLPNIIIQVFIIMYVVLFCYFYSGKKPIYIIYGLLAYVASILVQGIWYTTKARFIDYQSINNTTKSILALDYFIIMTIIILVKEIYLKKRGENNGRTRRTNLSTMDRRLQEGRKIRKETSKKSSKRS